MSDARKQLRAAKEALSNRDYPGALNFCKAVLKDDRNCFEAYVFVGKAAFHLHEYQQAEAAYTRACSLDGSSPLAWQGLAELYTKTAAWDKASQAYEQLAQLAAASPDAGLQAKASGFMRRAAEALGQAGQPERAEVWWRQLLAGAAGEEVLELQCRLVDCLLEGEAMMLAGRTAQRVQDMALQGVQMSEVMARDTVEAEWAEEELVALDQDTAAGLLRDIIAQVPPSPPYAKYYDAYLRRLRKATHAAPAGSMERHSRRAAVLHFALATIRGCTPCGTPGGCCSTLPYEAALAMLEVEGNVAGAAAYAAGRTSTGGVVSGPMCGRRPTEAAEAAARAAAEEKVAAAGVPGSIGVGGGVLGAELQLAGMEQVAKRLAHAYPWSASAGVHMALCLRRRVGPGLDSTALLQPLAPLATSPGHRVSGGGVLDGQSTKLAGGLLPPGERCLLMHPGLRRRNLIKALQGGLRAGGAAGSSASGWLAAAELLLDEGDADAALDAAKQGLAYLSARDMLGHEVLGQADLLLKLVVGRAMAAMGGAPSPFPCGHTAHILAAAQHAGGQGKGAAGVGEGGGGSRSEAQKVAGQEAEAWLKGLLLGGRIGGGVAPFARLAGSVAAADITQQATRCLAQLALIQGDTSAARDLYERLMGAAAMGRAGPLQGEAAHWVAAEYAALLLAQGQAEAALPHVHDALAALGADQPASGTLGAASGPGAAALHNGLRAQYLLLAARVCWQLGGSYRSSRGAHAHRYLLEAATAAEAVAAAAAASLHSRVAAAAQANAAAAFALLGDWYQAEAGGRRGEGEWEEGGGGWGGGLGEQQAEAGDMVRAEKCWSKALGLDPCQGGAGACLVALRVAEGKLAAATQLCDQAMERAAAAAGSREAGMGAAAAGAAGHASWALELLPWLHMQAGELEASVVGYQRALRLSPASSRLWEGLGCAYQALGRHSAALKSYSRALEIQPGRMYCLLQQGGAALPTADLTQALNIYKQ
ncbi:hypothetical protein V8C86DRAFT_3149766, partial [Haematococcus lacustris]